MAKETARRRARTGRSSHLRSAEGGTRAGSSKARSLKSPRGGRAAVVRSFPKHNHGGAGWIAEESPEARKRRGGFYTPRLVAEFLVKWAVRTPADRILDPSCGEAVFLHAARQRLLDLGVSEPGVATRLFGVELDPEAFALAQNTLGKGNGQEAPTLLQGDFFAVAPDLLGPPAVEAVVGNPPYIRYQLFSGESRRRGLAVAAQDGVVLPRLSSSWAPFVVHAASFVGPRGRLAMVLPAELLHVQYAGPVREFLLRTFRRVTVVAFEERIFPGALTEVVLILAERDAPEAGFRVIRLRDGAGLQGLHGTLDGIPNEATPPSGRWSESLLEGGALDTYSDLVARGVASPLSKVASVHVGTVTGANDFFLLSDFEVKERLLPPSVLFPCVSRAAHVTGARLAKPEWNALRNARGKVWLLRLGRGRAVPASVRPYLEEGEQKGLDRRFKCRVRDPWYAVPFVAPPTAFLTYMSNEFPRLVLNRIGARSTNTVHGVYPLAKLSARERAGFVVAFYNSLTLLSAELSGRSYGGGVLKLEPTEAEAVMFPSLPARTLASLGDHLEEVHRLLLHGDHAAVVELVDGRVLEGALGVERTAIRQVREVAASLRGRRRARGAAGREVA